MCSVWCLVSCANVTCSSPTLVNPNCPVRLRSSRIRVAPYGDQHGEAPPLGHGRAVAVVAGASACHGASANRRHSRPPSASHPCEEWDGSLRPRMAHPIRDYSIGRRRAAQRQEWFRECVAPQGLMPKVRLPRLQPPWAWPEECFREGSIHAFWPLLRDYSTESVHCTAAAVLGCGLGARVVSWIRHRSLVFELVKPSQARSIMTQTPRPDLKGRTTISQREAVAFACVEI